MPAPEERALFTPEDLERLDAEDRLYDEPGIDWEEIAESSEADRRAGLTMSLPELIRQCLEDLEILERMTPEELDEVIARDGEI